MSKVIRGEISVDDLVASKRQSGRLGFRKFNPGISVRVEVDNAVSDHSTVLEVYAFDRIGLLYDIARCIADLGLNISMAKITTERDQIADVFYVEDKDGAKIVDFNRINKIRDGLKNHLTTMEEALGITKKTTTYGSPEGPR
jgi:[protein-PII] uridylyltransferase